MNLFKGIKQMLKKLRRKWHLDLTTAIGDSGSAIMQGQNKLLEGQSRLFARTNNLERAINEVGVRSQNLSGGHIQNLDEFAKNVEIYQVYSFLQDRESQKLFWARLHISQNQDVAPLFLQLMQQERSGDPKDIIWMLNDRMNNKDIKDKLIIFGTTFHAKELFLAVKKLGCKVDYICKADTDDSFRYLEQPLKGYDWLGTPMITEEELLSKHKNAQIIVGYLRCWPAKQYLVQKGIPASHIWRRATGWGKQYLDEEIMRPHQHETYIDGGVLDLSDTLNFIEWCKGEYDAVYAFEPDGENYLKCEERLQQDPRLDKGRIHLLNAALWKHDEQLRFTNGGGGSSTLNLSASTTIPGRTIDSVLRGGPVTFIKLDIEGAELNALIGAKESIKKWKPRLAICIYHKPEDPIEIPLYIHSLVPEYKMFIRHYSTCKYETVLYCVCDKDL